MTLRVGSFLAGALLVACAQPEAAPEVTPGPASRTDPVWSTLGTGMSLARHSFSTTLLPNGRVLVAGGFDDAGTPLKLVEVYDPERLTFSQLGNLAFARTAHTATLLRDGRVLFAGGPTPNLELFTPQPDGGGTFATVASLAAPRSWHTATVLDDGRVLLVGGDSTRKACELFEPSDAGVSTCASTAAPHMNGSAMMVTLPSGVRQVMVAAGSGNAVELYDDLNNQWVPGQGTYSRSVINYASVHQLFDGGVLMVDDGNSGVGLYNLKATAPFTIPIAYSLTRIVPERGQTLMMPAGNLLLVAGGGLDPSCGVFTTNSVVELTTGPFAETDLTPPPGSAVDTAREFHGAVLLPTADVLAIGGQRRWGWAAPFPNTCVPTSWAQPDVWLLDTMSSRQRFTSLTALPAGRARHTTTLLTDGRLWLAGGEPGTGAVATTTLLASGTLSSSAGPMLTTPRAHHTATLLTDGRVLVVGGVDTGGARLASAEIFDPATGSCSPTGTLQTARSDHAATLLADGRVLITGGWDGTTPFRSAELYDPKAGSFTLLASFLPAGRFGHAVVTLPDGRLFAVGGQQVGTAPRHGAYIDQTTLTATAEAASTAMASDHSFAGAAVVGGKVFVAGGVTSGVTAVGTVDVFNLATETWSSVGLGATREGANAVRLLNDRLLVTGSGNSNATVFEPARGGATSVSLTGIHDYATATLLPDGTVAVLGGSSFATSADLFEEGRRPVDLARPTLVAPTAVVAGRTLQLSGTQLTGRVETSGGGTLATSTALPFVTFEASGGQRTTLPVTRWTPTSVTVTVPPQLIGWGWVRATVGAIPSIAIPFRVLRASGANCALDSDCEAGLACTSNHCAAAPTDGGVMDGGSTGGGAGGGSAGGGSAGGGSAGGGSAGGGSAGGGAAGGSAGGAAGGGEAGGGATAGGAGGGGDNGLDGGTGSSPGFYGCFCGSGAGPLDPLVLLTSALLMWRAARRRSAGLLIFALLVVTPQVARAAPGSGDARVSRVKVAVLPLQNGPGVGRELADVITDAIASALAARPELEVISQRDITARLGFERQKQLIGGAECVDSVDCMVEIGNALGVDKLTFGSIARLGGSAVLNTTVVQLAGNEVVRHTERVQSTSEEAFLDAIPPTVAALFPPAAAKPGEVAGASGVEGTAASPLDGARVGLTVRGQLAPMNLPSGAWVVHADFSFTEMWSAGLGVIIAKPFGVMARGTVVPFNVSGRVRPTIALEVPVLFSPEGVAVGVGGALGVEVRLLKQLAIGAEVPFSYYFGGPPDAQRFWLFGALTLTGRI